MDPLANKQPGWSPYKAFLDNPNLFIDPYGKTEYNIHVLIDERGGKTYVNVKVISNDVRTDGVQHITWVDQATYYKENFYYDFANVTVTTITKDNGIIVKKSTQNIKENGVKNKDFVIFGGAKPGETQSNWDSPKDFGVERSFGLNMSGSTGGSDAIGQDWSKNAIGDVSFEDLVSIFGQSSISKEYKPGSGSWQSISKDKIKGLIEKTKEAGEAGNKAGEAFEKSVETYKNNFVKTDSCRYCKQIGTKNEIEGHIDVVKRKGYEEKKK